MNKIVGTFAAGALLALMWGASPAGAQVPYPYPYGYAPYYNPAAGNLYGAASVIGAQNQTLTSVQQANLMKQDVKKKKIENQRSAFDEWMYEKKHTPTAEEERERLRIEELRRVRNDPPVTEIWAARPLNVLLDDVQRLLRGSFYATSAALSPDLLKRINVTGSRNDASLGLLRDDGKLRWPFVLRDPQFDKQRSTIDQLMLEAISQAKTGEVAFGTVKNLNAAVQKLTTQLKQQVANIPSNQWIEGKRYVDQLAGAVTLLQDTNVANYFNGKWEAKGNTVAELVTYMTQNGLRFAPATHGDETAYQSLYQDLRNYDTALGQQIAQAQMVSKGPAPKNAKQR